MLLSELCRLQRETNKRKHQLWFLIILYHCWYQFKSCILWTVGKIPAFSAYNEIQLNKPGTNPFEGHALGLEIIQNPKHGESTYQFQNYVLICSEVRNPEGAFKYIGTL